MNTILLKTYGAPPFCEKEALRYAGCKTASAEVLDLLNSCKKEADAALSYKVCYCELPLKITGQRCDFGSFFVDSIKLSKNLKGCGSVLLFPATIGVKLDRLIAKYGRIEPSKTLMLQAIGAERIEALCDAFCEDFEAEHAVNLRPRFSPGYGDVKLDIQKSIFSILDCPRKIGLTLNESLLMSPSKSVTAFAGITKEKTIKTYNKCELCGNTACEFWRKE